MDVNKYRILLNIIDRKLNKPNIELSTYFNLFQKKKALLKKYQEELNKQEEKEYIKIKKEDLK